MASSSSSLPLSVSAQVGVAILTLAFILGFPGNLFVVWSVLCRVQRRSVTCVLVLNLALADACVLLSAPFFLRYLAGGQGWEFGSAACKLVHYLSSVNMYVSIYLICLMSMDRWLAVTRPFLSQRMRTKRSLLLLLLVVWVSAFIFSLPMPFYRSAVMLWFVLLVLGQCLSVTCQLYHYYFINQEKTWEDAQNHCREKHTDLATVMSMEDVTSLLNAASENTGNTREAWIGLKNDGNFTWRWSLPGVDGKETNWDVNQPDNPRKENCGTMWKSGKWNNLVCSEMRNFICYDETNKKFHLIKEEKNWFEAQHYCREKHTDLVSGMNQLNQEELKKEANPNNVGSQEIFIGLFSDTWKWSDGRNMSFRHWHPDFFTDQLNVTRCATTSFNQTARNSKWGYNECNQTKTFFCYNVELVLIKANKTWTDALDYCRKHHKGLVSITTPGDQMLVQDMLQEATTEYVWLGLHYSCVVDLWLWVTDEPFCDDSWERYQLRRNECGVSAAMSTQSPYNWTTKCDQTPFNFICVK